MFHKRNCGSCSVCLSSFCQWQIEWEGVTSPKSTMSVWFDVNTSYLGRFSSIQYYLCFPLISRRLLLNYYEFGLTENHCMSLIGINENMLQLSRWWMCHNNGCCMWTRTQLSDGDDSALWLTLVILVALDCFTSNRVLMTSVPTVRLSGSFNQTKPLSLSCFT